MTLLGRSGKEYLMFIQPFLVLIGLLGMARLGLSIGGVPDSTTRWFSMSVVVFAGALYYGIRTHTARFGGYGHLLVICFLLNLLAQVIAVLGIVVAILTATDNVFSAPEYSFGGDGKTWSHVFAHLFIGTTGGTVVPWLPGSLVLAITRRFSAQPARIVRTP